MTLRTRTALLADLVSGGSSGKDIDHTLIRDMIDSFGSIVLYSAIGANMNITTDQAFVKNGVFTTYLVTFIRAVNASTNLTTAAGGIYDTASKGGTPLVAAAQAYAALIDATVGLDLTVAAYGKGVRTNPPILNLTTGQGGAATADFYVVGIPIS